jgi:hypothetical protein
MAVTIQLSPLASVGTVGETGLVQVQPYPITVEADGRILPQEGWKHSGSKVVGFVQNASVTKIHLWWKDLFSDLQQAVGLYLVVEDPTGRWNTYNSVTVQGIGAHVATFDGQTRASGIFRRN